MPLPEHFTVEVKAMRSRRVLGLCMLVTCVGLQQPKAQDVLEAQRVEIALAAHLAAFVTLRPVGLDAGAEEFGAIHESTGRPRAEYRSAAHFASLADSAKARLIQFDAAKFCDEHATAESDCIRTVVRIGVPRFEGDSALIWMYSYYPIERNTLFEERDVLFLMAKGPTGWVVRRGMDERLMIAAPTVP